MNTGDHEQVKKRKTKVQLKRERECEELRQLLSDKKMRSFIWRLLTECQIYGTANSHPQDIFRFEGRRDIGIWTLKEIDESDKNAYTIIREEGKATHG